MLGIGGVGMAGVALLLHRRGWIVSGCDAAPGPLGAWLKAEGISVRTSHDPDHITQDLDLVIRTPAVAVDTPELVRAEALGIPVQARGTVLPRLLDGQTSVAVSGTHGKTTTATFITQLLILAGQDPGWCIGSETSCPGPVAGVGDGHTLIVEADESDGTLVHYQPDIAVITNVEFDHMDHFECRDAFEACFREFIAATQGPVVYAQDDAQARTLGTEAKQGWSYGLGAGSRIRACNVVERAEGTRFDLEYDGQALGEHRIGITGRHNLLNALAALTVARQLGIEADVIREALPSLALPHRRFELVSGVHPVRVVSDYAHHPSEISAVMAMASHLPAERRMGVFQPHRYTRTRALGLEFPPAFDGLDTLVLLPVYAASEAPLEGGTRLDLYRRFVERAPESAGVSPEAPGNPTGSGEPVATRRPDVVLAPSTDAAWGYLREVATPSDLVLIIGAGDIGEMAEWARRDPLKAAISPELTTTLSKDLTDTTIREHLPLAGKTTLKVGGAADLWAEVGSLADLVTLQTRATRAGIPLKVIGNGSNLLIRDLGVRGITARLAGTFRHVEATPEALVAGAATPGPLLLTWMEKCALTGLEFLEGIPATVGGMLHMNAGAQGDELLAHVLWIRCLNPDGSVCTLGRSDLEYGYRRCATLERRVILAAGFEAVPGDLGTIREKRLAYAERRRWMRRLRCAGSAFKNPPGTTAAALIEAAGLKGHRIGGATVSEAHANVVVTDPGASASDVEALLQRVRDGVHRKHGVALELEIEVVGGNGSTCGSTANL